VAGWPTAPRAGELELLVSELVTNAIVHGRPPVSVRLTHVGDEVLVEVEDGSPGTPHRRRPDADEEHGRGLGILATLARRYGVTDGPSGKTVWCTVPVVPQLERTA
jgi:anti-sigma regulatory factor (Ser/Thr protein kinase)